MNSEPLVTIGFTARHGAGKFRAAVASLLEQDYAHFEVIVADPRLQWDVASLFKEFGDPRLRFASGGSSATGSLGSLLANARGDYIMFGDDACLWEPRYLSECLKALSQNPGAAFCSTDLLFLSGEVESSGASSRFKNLEATDEKAIDRIHELITQPKWYALYGVAPTEAIRKAKTPEIFSFELIEELLLVGKAIKVHEILLRRVHNDGLRDNSNHSENGHKMVSPFIPEFFHISHRGLQPEPHGAAMLHTQLALNLLGLVFDSELSRRDKSIVFADFLTTMSSPGSVWRAALTSEFSNSLRVATDTQFTRLLASLLSRAVPLSEMQDNPLMQAIFQPPLTTSRLIDMAKSMYNRRLLPPADSLFGTDKHRRGAQALAQGKRAEALRLVSEALVELETGDRWADWGTVQLCCDRSTEAQSGFMRALAIDPENSLAAAKLGIIMAQVGNYEEAVPYLERSLSALDGSQRGGVLRLLADCRAWIATHRPGKD